MNILEVEISFTGNEASNNVIELYDVATAIQGFQRSLALTTHLIVNNDIITQAPSLKNAHIYTYGLEPGSVKTKAIITTGAVFAGVWAVGTAPTDTPLGHLVHSAYSYVIQESLGFEVDYEKTLQKQIMERNAEKSFNLDQSRLDSVVEKCENSIIGMHRPIVKSATAIEANINCKIGHDRYPIQTPLSQSTYEYLAKSDQIELPEEFLGKITGYNINSFRGRIYIPDIGNRTVSFILSANAQTPLQIGMITESLSKAAKDRKSNNGFLKLTCWRTISSTGRLKFLTVLKIEQLDVEQ